MNKREKLNKQIQRSIRSADLSVAFWTQQQKLSDNLVALISRSPAVFVDKPFEKKAFLRHMDELRNIQESIERIITDRSKADLGEAKKNLAKIYKIIEALVKGYSLPVANKIAAEYLAAKI
jgi:hypothetical protein